MTTEAEYEARWRSYFYDGEDWGGTLINRLNLRYPEALTKAEYSIAQVRAFEVMDGAFEIPQTYDLEHYLAIHKALLGDVYEWAGTVRDVPLFKNGTWFSEVEMIAPRFQHIEQLVRSTDWHSLPREQAMDELGRIYNAVNMAHPCREGNGRATRLFMRDVAAYAGYEFHEARLTRDELIAAAVAGAHADHAPAAQMFRTHCYPEPSAATRLAAREAVPPTSTLAERIDRLYAARASQSQQPYPTAAPYVPAAGVRALQR